jgi:hypothetical protein
VRIYGNRLTRTLCSLFTQYNGRYARCRALIHERERLIPHTALIRKRPFYGCANAREGMKTFLNESIFCVHGEYARTYYIHNVPSTRAEHSGSEMNARELLILRACRFLCAALNNEQVKCEKPGEMCVKFELQVGRNLNIRAERARHPFSAPE